MLASWLLAGLCAALLAALWWALSRLAELSAEPPAAAQPAQAGGGRLKERLDALLALSARGQTAAGLVTREGFCRAVLEAACTALRAEEAELFVFEEGRGALVPVATVGAASAARREVRPGEGPAGRAFRSGKLERSAGVGVPFVSVPLVAMGDAIGVLSLYRSDAAAAPIDATDESFLGLLAREAALALHHLQLLESQESFSIEMLQVLARAAEAKDQALGNSERSRALAKKVAQELRLPPGEVRHVEYAAMLHRVGKIGVDQTLLSKPGKLSPAEYEQIKKYTTIGAEILSRAKSLEPVARIVLHQQEWFNGKGYPDGLRGEGIPVGARIVAVVNAWEAMRQDRPYRKALAREVAFAELRKGAGAQFDPAVVEAFLKTEGAGESAAAST